MVVLQENSLSSINEGNRVDVNDNCNSNSDSQNYVRDTRQPLCRTALAFCDRPFAKKALISVLSESSGEDFRLSALKPEPENQNFTIEQIDQIRKQLSVSDLLSV